MMVDSSIFTYCLLLQTNDESRQFKINSLLVCQELGDHETTAVTEESVAFTSHLLKLEHCFQLDNSLVDWIILCSSGYLHGQPDKLHIK